MQDTNELLALLQHLGPEELEAMFAPYAQEQGVLDQEMALAEALRRPGPERSTPMGAALGGLGNVVGNVGGAFLQQKGLDSQRALGTRMQRDAAKRMMTFQEMERLKAVEDFLRNRNQALPLVGGG